MFQASTRRNRVQLSSSYIVSILNNDASILSLDEISINKSVETISVLQMVLRRCSQTKILEMKNIYDENILKKSKKVSWVV